MPVPTLLLNLPIKHLVCFWPSRWYSLFYAAKSPELFDLLIWHSLLNMICVKTKEQHHIGKSRGFRCPGACTIEVNRQAEGPSSKKLEVKVGDMWQFGTDESSHITATSATNHQTIHREPPTSCHGWLVIIKKKNTTYWAVKNSSSSVKYLLCITCSTVWREAEGLVPLDAWKLFHKTMRDPVTLWALFSQWGDFKLCICISFPINSY